MVAAYKTRWGPGVHSGLQCAGSAHTSSGVTEPRYSGGLSFLGNRLPDREARVEEFFLRKRRNWRKANSSPRRQWLGG